MIFNLPKDCLYTIIEMVGAIDRIRTVSKQGREIAFDSLIQVDRCTDQQIRMITQTFSLIKKSHLSAKKEACFKALVASRFSTSLKMFNSLAVADIPHFILTRCWSIMIGSKIRTIFKMAEKSLFTEKSFSALVHAYKNTLSVVPDNLFIIPRLIMSGPKPILGEKDPNRSDYCSWRDFIDFQLLNILIDNQNLTFTNVRVLTIETRTDLMEKVITAVSTRLKGEADLPQNSSL